MTMGRLVNGSRTPKEIAAKAGISMAQKQA